MQQRDIELFDAQGFVKISNALPADRVQNMGVCVDACMENAIGAFLQGNPVKDVAYKEGSADVYVTRINRALQLVGAEVLAMMGHPVIVDIATALCGSDAVPIYESVVVRNRGDETPIIWHQDMIYQRHSRIVTLGVQLDTVGNDSALLFIPGSQTKKQDICTLAEQCGYEGNGIVQCSIERGDILLHDAMTVHASQPLVDRQRRRTLYIEFRSAAQAYANTGFSSEWLALRQHLFAEARRMYKRVCAEASAVAEYSADERILVDTIEGMDWRIETGHYCFHSTPLSTTEEAI